MLVGQQDYLRILSENMTNDNNPFICIHIGLSINLNALEYIGFKFMCLFTFEKMYNYISVCQLTIYYI